MSEAEAMLDELDAEKRIGHLAETMVLGETMIAELRDVNGCIGVIRARAQRECADAVRRLIDADLFSERGLAEARRAQNDIKRFRDMDAWIAEQIEDGINAADELKDEERRSPDGELKDEMNGREDRDPVE